ncbi:polyamine aminopropyltransferase [Pelagibaculum spongiae]|uniref:Polyamine aminopropyltransferase n=1 Tax=Pelagibaculum spongiae TaxID=2080658 RepID=A0A2V1GV48_9GAMM|nr:polyamine aminopropyltransferase [Pelagibaculum spongiae]PVZ63864.1 polyamine aminopropyltransferase [Pelagibaculum spongiae]
MKSQRPIRLIAMDVFLIGMMALLAGCGLIYEYLLSHYAARVLGAVESTIYAMIGLMIVSMGMGAFTARLIKQSHRGFAWLESWIALVGSAAILLIAAVIGFAEQLPQLAAETYQLPPDSRLYGLFSWPANFAQYLPFVAGTFLGWLIGMEIPLIARIREDLYGQHLVHNAGTIYGADYIGAGLGAAIWVLLLLKIDINTAAVLTASVNLLVGIVFLVIYRKKIGRMTGLVILQLALIASLGLMWKNGSDWMSAMSDTLFVDKVIYRQNTPYQQLVVTQRKLGRTAPVYDLYINGRLQFSSQDEKIYHSYLVYPAMAAAARTDNVLVIGGGDGLALRNILRWDPKQVTLIDLDSEMVEMFSEPKDVSQSLPSWKQFMLDLNQRSFSDQRVEKIYGDAFIEIDPLIQTGRKYDVIIVDLPDPSHPNLNKLYSRHFYARLKQLLNGDGAITVQSTSPYHAQKAFISIGKTLQASGFAAVDPYHANVPSFGEWGWHLAVPLGQSGAKRLQRLSSAEPLPVADDWITSGLVQGAFQFGKNFLAGQQAIAINRLGSHVVYQYHFEAWKKDQGLYTQFGKQE